MENKRLARSIMIQGTASSVGKSIIAAALCRVFRQDGRNVAPFKSQNMALNSFATGEGLEMGRAQVVQAHAARVEPSVLMNPVLLKPTADSHAQVIVMGKPLGNMSAREYHDFKHELRPVVTDAYLSLAAKYDTIVIEGAGSPAEINLRDRDLVNMGMARIADAPVLLVGDIDRGGVFASLVGTMALLTEEERGRVRGVIINKFRGDLSILQPGLVMLEEIIKVPVLGVLPYTEIGLEDEDSVTESFARRRVSADIEVAVLWLPHIANFTDFDVFKLFNDVSLSFIAAPEDLHDADLIIIPGSKNTIGDLLFLRESGLEEVIRARAAAGVAVVGICGGYQMLGAVVADPAGLEGVSREVQGLGLLPVRTVLEPEKITEQVRGTVACDEGLCAGLKGAEVTGYEIHMGRTEPQRALSDFVRTASGDAGFMEGNVIGTYLHGVFDSVPFTRGFLNNLRRRKGLEPLGSNDDFGTHRERMFDRLARLARERLDMRRIYEILDGERHGEP